MTSTPCYVLWSPCGVTALGSSAQGPLPISFSAHTRKLTGSPSVRPWTTCSRSPVLPHEVHWRRGKRCSRWYLVMAQPPSSSGSLQASPTEDSVTLVTRRRSGSDGLSVKKTEWRNLICCAQKEYFYDIFHLFKRHLNSFEACCNMPKDVIIWFIIWNLPKTSLDCRHPTVNQNYYLVESRMYIQSYITMKQNWPCHQQGPHFSKPRASIH